MIGFTRGVVALSLTQALVAISVLGAFAFNLPLSVPAPMLLGLAAGAVTASMAAAASVAWRTTRVSPLEALRYE